MNVLCLWNSGRDPKTSEIQGVLQMIILGGVPSLWLPSFAPKLVLFQILLDTIVKYFWIHLCYRIASLNYELPSVMPLGIGLKLLLLFHSVPLLKNLSDQEFSKLGDVLEEVT